MDSTCGDQLSEGDEEVKITVKCPMCRTVGTYQLQQAGTPRREDVAVKPGVLGPCVRCQVVLSWKATVTYSGEPIMEGEHPLPFDAPTGTEF